MPDVLFNPKEIASNSRTFWDLSILRRREPSDQTNEWKSPEEIAEKESRNGPYNAKTA